MANDSKSLELQIRIATEEALKAVSSLKGEIQALAGEAKKFEGNGGSALKDSFRDAEKAAKETSMSIGDIKKALGSLAEVVAAAKALSVIKDMGAFALQTADNFQTARNQFGTLLGDMQAGAGLFNQIKTFNDKTPFSLDTLTQATNVLIAAKVPLKDLQAELTKFGDLSQGNSEKMTSYVNAFSQAAAKGKADMQVLNTYIHQGVPILDALAKGFGVTTAEIVEMSSQGKISFADFSKALDDLTASGGQYFGGMELGSKSLAAMQEGLKESVNSLAASFGEMLLPGAIAVVEALTNITNAINNSPLLKGLLVGAIVMLTGYLASMAVKAVVAFAAQMSLNLAIGAMNPVVLASTIAVAGLAAGYMYMSSTQQASAREAENLAFQQRQQKDAIDATRESVMSFAQALKNMSDVDLDKNITLINREIDEIKNNIVRLEQSYNKAVANGNKTMANYWADQLKGEKENLDRALGDLNNAQGVLSGRRTSWIDSMYGNTEAGKLEKLTAQLAIAQNYLTGANLPAGERTRLQEVIKNLNAEIENLSKKASGAMSEMDRMASKWKESWANTWNKFQADESMDPFAGIELERGKKLADAWENYVRSGNKETIDQVNAYYDAQRGKVSKNLVDKEEQMQRELSKTKVDDLQYEMSKALEAIDTLEAQRIIAAGNSEEEIAAIREHFAAMRGETESQFKIKIDKQELEEALAPFKEAKEAVVDWQTTLADNLSLALMNTQKFSDEAAIILGQLAAQFIELSASSALNGFEEFGRALGEGKDAAESLQAAMAAMAQQILRQLPMMFLQAGLQLIANGQWQLGIGFIAAAGSSAIISGYVDGASKAARKNAQGGVYDEYGQAARAFAAGGTFTNQIVNQPTYFRHGGGLGLMGEAGPEAILPLRKMASGNLGVEAGSGGTNVIVNIINNSGAEVSQEEKTGPGGNKQIDVIIGSLVNNHIASGKADRVMGSRYNLRAAGV